MKFQISREIDASPEQVWAIIADFNNSTAIRENQTIIKNGDNKGIGTIREIKLGKSIFTERIEAIESGKTIEYSIIAGVPLKWYKGKGIIKSSQRPTLLEWYGEFEANFPIPNFMAKIVAQKNVNQYLNAVEKALKA